MEAYAASRDRLIAHITQVLADDPRFVAAWLEGSFGRGQADALSDLDLVVVVDDPYSAELCARPWMTRGETTGERLALFRRFGEPAIIHENNHNALAGTFTFVVYAGSALMVDWELVPRSAARRPASSRLLFDRAGIPSVPPAASPDAGERAAAVGERIAFFWMMAAVTAKYILRRDTIKVLGFVEMLHQTAREAERRLSPEPLPDRRGALGTLVLTPAEQVEAVRDVAGQVDGLARRLAAEGVEAPPSPWPELELLLGLAEGVADVH